MKRWFLNLEERFKDLPEVRARRFPSRFRVPPAGEAARHVFPDSESGPNMDTCPSMTFVFISHLLGNRGFLLVLRVFPETLGRDVLCGVHQPVIYGEFRSAVFPAML